MLVIAEAVSDTLQSSQLHTSFGHENDCLPIILS